MILRLVREDTRDEECENEMAETDALAERDEEGAPEAAERDGFTAPGGDVPDGAVSDTPQDGEEEKEAGPAHRGILRRDAPGRRVRGPQWPRNRQRYAHPPAPVASTRSFFLSRCIQLPSAGE